MAEPRYDLSPQLDLVKRIVVSEYADTLYPFTSHWALCISTAADVVGRENVPMICIEYRGNSSFRVEYWSRPGRSHDLQREECEASRVWPILESLFLRLKIEAEAAHAT